MPTYKNISSRSQTINGKVIEPGQTFHTLGYLDENTARLLKVDDKPYYNPIILSETVDIETIISIPKLDNLRKPLEKFSIHFYVEEGVVRINYNSIDNKPDLLLYNKARWNIRCFERNINQLHIRPNSPELPFKVYIIVEKL